MTPADRYREINAALMHGAPNEEGRGNAALMHGAQNEEGKGTATLTHGARNEEREQLSSSGAAGISSLSDSRSPSSHRAPVQHNRLRRKADHDYSAAGIYLITVTTTNLERLLGKLAGSTADEAHIEPTAIGGYVIEAFRKMAATVTAKTGTPVQVLQYQLMPDHFHGIIYIREALPKGWSLGKMIGTWKGDCSREYWRINAALTHGAPNEEGREPLLAAGYNDRILFHEGQLKNWIAYLHDNPRRLWLKMHHPNRLRKVYEFQAGTPEHRYTAIGNTFLLTYPERVQVRCHRNLTEEQIKSEVEHYLALARSGAVLVSPFISPAEKAVFEACYNERLRMIHIVNRGLDGRFIYPSDRDLEGCSEGFMLVLAPYPDYSAETADTRISRAQCLDMNAYAAELSTNVALTRDAPNDQTPR